VLIRFVLASVVFATFWHVPIIVAQPDSDEADASAESPVEAQWSERLTALDPSDPESYFLLGEEVADQADHLAETNLAQRLFVLAFELDRRRGAESSLGASVCMALASIERLEERAAWLRALAGALDERYAATDWNVERDIRIDDETGLLAAEVLGLTRAGEGIKAQNILDRHPEVLELLSHYERLLGLSAAGGGIRQLRDAIRFWPCPECKNNRVLPRMGTDPLQYRLCYTCLGNPGPQLTLPELIAQLRFESRLLQGVQRSWAAQVAVDYGAPLRDPDPSDLAPTLEVDPSRPYWRDGRWLTREGLQETQEGNAQ